MPLKEHPLLESARFVPGSHPPARRVYSVVRSDAPREPSGTAIGHTYAVPKMTRFRYSCEYRRYSRDDSGQLIMEIRNAPNGTAALIFVENAEAARCVFGLVLYVDVTEGAGRCDGNVPACLVFR